jgi:hypothetical protein
MQSVGIEPTLLRTRALSVRLNRSAKTAITNTSHPGPGFDFDVLVCCRASSRQNMTSWRNGNASDSRPEDWGFDSL